MGKSDTLSWRSDHGSGSKDNQNLTLLTPSLFAVRALEGLPLGDKHSKPCPTLVELSMYQTTLLPSVVYHLPLTYPTLLSSLSYQ